MTTEDFLSNTFGISMNDARDFILANYEMNLSVIYDVCIGNGVNNDMIADILGIQDLTGLAVSNYFSLHGFDGNALGFNNTSDTSTGHGDLDMSNLHQYSSIIVYENISATGIQIALANHETGDLYYYDNAANILDAADYGYTDLITSMDLGAGVQMNMYSLPGDYTHAFTETSLPGYSGDYDLAVVAIA